jgi:hypothetical protein
MTDWSKVILDLRGAGMKTKSVASRCGIDKDTLYALLYKRAKEPRYSVGTKLLELHKALCPERQG